MKTALIILLSIAAGAVGATYLRRADFQAETAPQRIEAGFVHLNGEQAAANAKLRAHAIQTESQIVELLREGYGHATEQELSGYLADFQWAKANLPAASEYEPPLDRNITWCEHRLKPTHAAATRR
jgi:hypothetical protein